MHRLQLRTVATYTLVFAASCGTSAKSVSTTNAQPTTPSVEATVLAATVRPPVRSTSTSNQSTTAASTTTSTPASTTTSSGGTIDSAPAANPCGGIDFRNFTYYLPDYEIVTVADGQGTRGSPGAAGYVAVQVRDIATGDIGGADTAAETAVFLDAETGGDGRYSDVYIFTCSPTAVTLVTSAVGGDRAYGGVRAVAIRGGKLMVDRYSDDNGACCPGAATRTTYTLSETKLVSDSKPLSRKLTLLSGQKPVSLTFLYNSSSAVLQGDTANSQPGGFNAFGGQTLSLEVEPSGPDQGKIIMDVMHDSIAVRSVASGSSTSFTLPSDGYYQVVARPAVDGVTGRFDAEVTIT